MIDACPDSAVLFFDVDGTLTSFDPDNLTDKDLTAIRPSRAVIDSFHKLRDAGHKAFICTGRPLWLIADGLRALDPAGIVAMGGATLEIKGHVVHEDCIDEGVVGELARRMAAAGAEAMFETNAMTFALAPADVEQSYLPGASVVHDVDQMCIEGRLRVGKVCLFAQDLARIANDDDFIGRNFELCNTGGRNRELSPKGIDKGVGVARALEYLGRAGNARTFGFGDSGNDLGMLAAVETAVAMGNAMPRGQGCRRLRDRRRRARRHCHGYEAFRFDLSGPSSYRSPASGGSAWPALQNRFAAGGTCSKTLKCLYRSPTR